MLTMYILMKPNPMNLILHINNLFSVVPVYDICKESADNQNG